MQSHELAEYHTVSFVPIEVPLVTLREALSARGFLITEVMKETGGGVFVVHKPDEKPDPTADRLVLFRFSKNTPEALSIMSVELSRLRELLIEEKN